MGSDDGIMASGEVKNNGRCKYYEDSYGHVFYIDESRQPISGGQGQVLWTSEPGFLLKLSWAPGNKEGYNIDESKNQKYLDLCLLPIPEGSNIAIPLSTLKGVEGYVMEFLEDMEPFRTHFAINKASARLELDSARDYYAYLSNSVGEKYVAFLQKYMGTGGIRRRYIAYLSVAISLARLHSNGLIYCDFSPNNVFISSNQDYSNVWLIDSDNIRYSEADGPDFYTPGFCAPEVAAGTGVCSFYSDIFSFACALFEQLLQHAPFEGTAYYDKIDELDCREQADEMKDQGEFGWILDRSSNNYFAGCMKLEYANLLTDGVYKLFQRTFSEKSRLECEYIRPSMAEWANQLAYAYDNTVFADSCGRDYVADGEEYQICPFDKQKVAVVRFMAYLADERGERLSDVPLWMFTHEQAAGIDLPLRLLTGFSGQSLSARAFRMEINDTKMKISGECSNLYSYSFSTDGFIFEEYNSYEASKGKIFILCSPKSLANDVQTVLHILLEGEMR